MNIHEKYIKRCIDLALNGLGTTYPNPMVGSVIVHNNKIIGEGWHQMAGGPHAEVNAINSVKDQSVLKDATIYVSLEPCSHYGKTPPCSDLIVAKGIKKVVIGTLDPYAEVSGRGIKKLFENGCEVTLGVLEEDCKNLNKRFFTYHQKKRPYVILKWAQTEDCFIAPLSRDERQPVWITNRYSRQLVHKWRAEEQGILVGTSTAIEDNPKLDTRTWSGNNPTRFVLDRNLKIPTDSAVYNGESKTIILKQSSTQATPEHSSKDLYFEDINFDDSIAEEILRIAYKHQIQSLIIEGGSKTLQTFIDADLWDEARVFTGDSQFKEGVKAPIFEKNYTKIKKIENDTLKVYYND